MSYPKRCVKCDQFGSWCFCVFPVEPKPGLIWMEYDGAAQRYTATYEGRVLYLDYTAQASFVRNTLQGGLDLDRDEFGSYGIPFTPEIWLDLLDVGSYGTYP